MEDAIKTVTVVWDYVTKMPAHMLLVLALNVVGFILKKIPGVPNDIIPGALVLLGAIVYPMIGNPGQVSGDLRNPQIVLVIFGVILAGGAWLLHVVFLKRGGKYVRKIPLVGDVIGDALGLDQLA